MKQKLPHILFWTIYLLQDVLLVYLLNSTRMHDSPSRELLMSVENCLLLLIPKLFFTYFMLLDVLGKIVKQVISIQIGIISGALALLASLLLYRAISFYVVGPMVYHWPVHDNSFLNVFSFLVALMDIGFVSGAAIAIWLFQLQ
ncbi:MAG TPA: hypothetical protein VFV08_13645, partial [Puia sp.]|nr:hypothetical protein [Puia sp.]